MPIVPKGNALRQPLRSCAIGFCFRFVFFAVWQLLAPAPHSDPLTDWAFILAASVGLSSGVGLPVSATRRLWRSTQRGRSVLPALFLVVVVVVFPSAASAANAHSLISMGFLLMALLVSAVFSAYLIITAKDAPPMPSPPTSFNADDPDAYVSDIPPSRKTV